MRRLRSPVVRGTKGASARLAALAVPALTLLGGLVAACSAAGEAAGWCGLAERVLELEGGGRDRVAVESPAAGELADAYEVLAAAVPATLAADAALMREFTATIRAELEAGASALDVIDRATHDLDVSAVEAAHTRLFDAVGEQCAR